MGLWEKLNRLFGWTNGSEYAILSENDHLWIRVPVYVNGRKLNFLLDTGAVHSMIGLRAATDLKLEDAGFTQKMLGVGGEATLSFVKVASLKAGNLGFSFLFMGVGASPELLMAWESAGIDGILGMDVLRHFILTVDPRKKSASLKAYPKEKTTE